MICRVEERFGNRESVKSLRVEEDRIIATTKFIGSLETQYKRECYTNLSAMPLHSTAHSRLIDSSPRISATRRAPCSGGFEYIGRTSIFN